jgi:hypothetical protein
MYRGPIVQDTFRHPELGFANADPSSRCSMAYPSVGLGNARLSTGLWALGSLRLRLRVFVSAPRQIIYLLQCELTSLSMFDELSGSLEWTAEGLCAVPL